MVSVCVPYWNDGPALDTMVRLYRKLYPDLALEFVVADDGSHRLPAEHPDCTIVRLPNKTRPLNPCVPINAAVAASTGEYVALTKVKVWHNGPVLLEMLELHQTRMDYVTARCLGIGYGPAQTLLAGPGVDYTMMGRLPVPPGGHFHFLALFHRSLWKKAGGFDEAYRNVQAADDNDWLWRLHAVGARFKSTVGSVSQQRSQTKWNLPHGRDLFHQKWPHV